MEYEKQANEFAQRYGITLEVLDQEYRKYFPEDKQARWVFTLRLRRNKKQYTFTFGQSIAAGGEEPSMYAVLAALTKYDPEDFENFCSEYGYSDDSISALRTYKAVVKEYQAVVRLFGDIIDELNEIH